MAAKNSKGTRTRARKSSKTKSKRLARSKAPKKKKRAVSKPRQGARQGRANTGEFISLEEHGRGARSAGQSGDTQGLATESVVDSASVEQLLEEGQSFEAEVLDGVENAPDPDQAEVYTREVNQDDVPDEYREKD